MAAVRVSLSWFGTRKTLTAEQKSQAADTFGAEGAFLSAGKKLLDTKHEKFEAVTAVKGRIISLWKGMSLPYPESGNRLIGQDQMLWPVSRLTVAGGRRTPVARQTRVRRPRTTFALWPVCDRATRRDRRCPGTAGDLTVGRSGGVGDPRRAQTMITTTLVDQPVARPSASQRLRTPPG
jgi:hypothetical protein